MPPGSGRGRGGGGGGCADKPDGTLHAGGQVPGELAQGCLADQGAPGALHLPAGCQQQRQDGGGWGRRLPESHLGCTSSLLRLTLPTQRMFKGMSKWGKRTPRHNRLPIHAKTSRWMVQPEVTLESSGQQAHWSEYHAVQPLATSSAPPSPHKYKSEPFAASLAMRT